MQAQIVIEIRHWDAKLCEFVPFENPDNKGPLGICCTRPIFNPGVGMEGIAKTLLEDSTGSTTVKGHWCTDGQTLRQYAALRVFIQHRL